jgi:PKD repeat protein
MAIRPAIILLSAVTASAQTAPPADFVADKTEAIPNENVVITYIPDNNNPADEWNWSISPALVNGNKSFIWGNGTSNISEKPVLLFSYPGTYSVTLIAGNSACSCSNTLTKKDYITVVPAVKMCGAGMYGTDTLRDQVGYLYDDGGKDNQYGLNKNCMVVIKPPCADSILLTFKSFDVSIHNHSGVPAGDYLKIYDGRYP